MTYYQYQKSVQTEIEKLNQIIDRHILRGQSYRDEARRHRELTRQLKLARKARPGFQWYRFKTLVSLF